MKKLAFAFALVGLLSLGYFLGNQFGASEMPTQRALGEEDNLELKAKDDQVAEAVNRPSILAESDSGEKEQAMRVMADKFKKAGLTKPKIEAMFGLDSFYQDMPVFNEENLKKRNELYAILNEDVSRTAESFEKLMDGANADEESLRTFLLNTSMGLNFSDEEKASLVVSRVNQGAKYREDGTVEDNELSMMIGIAHLARMKDGDAKAQAIEEMINHGPKDHSGFRQIMIDYFPEYKDKF